MCNNKNIVPEPTLDIPDPVEPNPTPQDTSAKEISIVPTPVKESQESSNEIILSEETLNRQTLEINENISNSAETETDIEINDIQISSNSMETIEASDNVEAAKESCDPVKFDSSESETKLEPGKFENEPENEPMEVDDQNETELAPLRPGNLFIIPPPTVVTNKKDCAMCKCVYNALFSRNPTLQFPKKIILQICASLLCMLGYIFCLSLFWRLHGFGEN